MKQGIVENKMYSYKINRIIWEEGEFESLREDVMVDVNDVTRLKPENALNLLKLAVANMMQKRSTDEDIVFREEEKLLYTSVFGGTFLNERGQILWNLLDIISPIVLKKTES